MTEDSSTRSLREELAELEHRQWMHWSQHVAENNDIPDSLHEKWNGNWEPYDALDEETKDHDRKWADKVLDILEERGLLEKAHV